MFAFGYLVLSVFDPRCPKLNFCELLHSVQCEKAAIAGLWPDRPRAVLTGGGLAEPLQFKYRAFLSYSHRDTAWGRWLHRALEAYRIEKDLVGRTTPAGPVPAALRPIFRDREDFAAGHSLTEQTLAALAGSQFLIVICSPNAAQSTYVNEEIRRFKAMGRAERVIALIVDGEPGDAQRECFPPMLRFKVGPDGALTEEREEPIAADARPHRDGKAIAVQKVVAGLIAVPLDDIRKRHEITWRRQTTIRTLIGLSAAVLAIVAGYFTWLASEQSRREELRSAESIKQQVEIKTLVKKLVALNQAPAAPGREQAVGEAVATAAKGAAQGDDRLRQALELLQENKVAEAEPLFRAVAEEKEQTAAAARKTAAAARKTAASADKEAAAAYRNLGAIAGLADPKRAREAYARAVALDPDDREALYWHGWLQFLAGNLDLAERDLGRLLQASISTQDERGIYRAHLRLGELLIERGNLEAARERQLQALDIAIRNNARDPGDQEWQRDLSVSYIKLGDMLRAQGNLPEALKSFRDSLAIFDRLAQADPNNASGQHDLGICYEKVGDVLLDQGKLPEAQKFFRESLAIADRFAKADPGNVEWQRELSLLYDRLGDVLVKQGNLSEALKFFRDGLAIRDRLAKADPANVQRQVDLVLAHWRLASRGDDPVGHWTLIVAVLRQLKAEGKLTDAKAQLLPEAEKQLTQARLR